MTATFYVGDAIKVMDNLPEKSVDLILTSPPFLALRSYLPADHPDKALEGGSQSTPGEYIDWLIDVVEACDRVLAPHGSLVFELGDTYSGSGGGGGDYLEGGWREGQAQFAGSAASMKESNAAHWRQKNQKGKLAEYSDARGNPDGMRDTTFSGGNTRTGGGRGWPLAKSLSLIPESFRWAMVYGHNPHTGRQTAPWRLRNVIRWVRPNPPVGALGDKFRPATSELMVFCKSAKRFFDLDAVREPLKDSPGNRYPRVTRDWDENSGKGAGFGSAPIPPNEYSAGAPPLDWWNIPPSGYAGAHYAVFPPELCVKPIKAMSPEKVCRTCGEPSRRIVEVKASFDQHYALARHIKDRRIASGYSLAEVNGWFGYTPETHNWETSGKGISIPNPDDWPIIKERLGLSDEFDELVFGDRRWTESTVDYLTENGQVLALAERRVAYDRGGLPPVDASRVKANRQAPETFSDCSHDDWRPGLILDPFAGTGTTLAVATGHGRDAIGIDLDERNYDLALDRVGPFILTRGEIAA